MTKKELPSGFTFEQFEAFRGRVEKRFGFPIALGALNRLVKDYENTYGSLDEDDFLDTYEVTLEAMGLNSVQKRAGKRRPSVKRVLARMELVSFVGQFQERMTTLRISWTKLADEWNRTHPNHKHKPETIKREYHRHRDECIRAALQRFKPADGWSDDPNSMDKDFRAAEENPKDYIVVINSYEDAACVLSIKPKKGRHFIEYEAEELKNGCTVIEADGIKNMPQGATLKSRGITVRADDSDSMNSAIRDAHKKLRQASEDNGL
ncbi:MAG: hypothetical protein ABFD49_05345 [Armatimonadota bacterium]|nr:hypothetical protein [bacterium]